MMRRETRTRAAVRAVPVGHARRGAAGSSRLGKENVCWSALPLYAALRTSGAAQCRGSSGGVGLRSPARTEPSANVRVIYPVNLTRGDLMVTLADMLLAGLLLALGAAWRRAQRIRRSERP
jgi:hypothetical protein